MDRATIERLRRSGTPARRVEKMQALHMADRDKVREELQK
jgi:hypothetical protein